MRADDTTITRYDDFDRKIYEKHFGTSWSTETTTNYTMTNIDKHGNHLREVVSSIETRTVSGKILEQREDSTVVLRTIEYY